MEIHLKVIGYLLVLLAIIHLCFPKYFRWKEELKKLNLINNQMMKVHTFFIALTVLLMGLLCITSSKELIETNFGNRISFGLGVFWLARLIVQFFCYSSALWRGKIFETIIHVLFSLLWIYLTVIFFLVAIN
mgnify:CR=1 FL=1